MITKTFTIPKPSRRIREETDGAEEAEPEKPPKTAEETEPKESAETAEEAYEHVLAKAGTIHRDVIEQRVVDEVRNKQAQYKGTTLKKAGFIDSPDDAEGFS